VSPEDSRARVRAVIVDDEPLARTNLRILLRRYPQIEIAGEPESGKRAIEEIRRNKADLVFLDIQMPELDGFDVVEMLGGDVPPAVVFVTAYDQHAIRAFDSGALDYLLKPFDNARFERALFRALDRIQGYRAASGPSRLGHLTVKCAGQVLFLQAADIDWIEAADYYARLHIGSKTHMLRRSMSELERDLDPAVFCRIHRSAIVNLGSVRGLQFSRNGELEALLGNGSKLPISRRCRKQLQSALACRQ